MWTQSLEFEGYDCVMRGSYLVHFQTCFLHLNTHPNFKSHTNWAWLLCFLRLTNPVNKSGSAELKPDAFNLSRRNGTGPVVTVNNQYFIIYNNMIIYIISGLKEVSDSSKPASGNFCSRLAEPSGRGLTF